MRNVALGLVSVLLLHGAGCRDACVRNDDGACVLPEAPIAEAGDPARQWTPLHAAAIRGDAVAIRAGLQAGADVNARGQYDMTPLHWAAMRGNADAAAALVAAGADLDAPSLYGTTPLHGAATAKIVRLLVEAGANRDARDRDGMTPLHLARSEEVAKALIDGGADILARSRDNRKPVDMLALADERGRLVVYPQKGHLRMRGNETRTLITLRNVSPHVMNQLRLEVVPEEEACTVEVQPPVLAVVNPAQRAGWSLLLRRNPAAEPKERAVRFRVWESRAGREVEVVTFKLSLNTRMEETPEDRGLMRIGSVQVRAEPAPYQWAAYFAAPVALVVLWLLARRGRSEATAMAAREQVGEGKDAG